MTNYGNIRLPQTAGPSNSMIEDEESPVVSNPFLGDDEEENFHAESSKSAQAPESKLSREPASKAAAPARPGESPLLAAESGKKSYGRAEEAPASSPAPKRTRNRMKRLSEEDLLLLQWVAYCRFTTVKQVSVHLGREPKKVLRQLTRLKSGLWVRDELGPGRMTLWRLDGFGYSTLLDFGMIDELVLPAKQRISESRVRHQLLVNHSMSLFITGSKKARVGFPLLQAYRDEPPRLEDFVTEYGMQSDFGSMQKQVEEERRNSGEAKAFMPLAAAKAYRELEEKMVLGPGKYVLTGNMANVKQKLADSQHVPDFVLANGKYPLYGEVEITPKDPMALQRIMQVYQDNGERYGGVLWLVEEGSPVRKHLEAAMRKVAPPGGKSLLDSGKAMIVPLRKHDGTVAGRFDIV